MNKNPFQPGNAMSGVTRCGERVFFWSCDIDEWAFAGYRQLDSERHPELWRRG